MSGNARFTVPCAGAPSRTMLGLTDSEEMMPWAGATAGSASSPIAADRVARRAARRMYALTRAARAGFSRHRPASHKIGSPGGTVAPSSARTEASISRRTAP